MGFFRDSSRDSSGIFFLDRITRILGILSGILQDLMSRIIFKILAGFYQDLPSRIVSRILFRILKD